MVLESSGVVVGVDGTESARQAATWAAAEARQRRVGLRLVYAYTSPLMIYPALELDAAGVDRSARAGAERMLAELARELIATSGIRVTTSVRSGHPVAVLREESESAVLTVVGAHGSRQFAEALLGSVAARVAGRARSPLVVVRTPHPSAPLPAEGPVVVGVDTSPEARAALAFGFEQASRYRVPIVAVHCWNEQAVAHASAWIPFEVSVTGLAAVATERLHDQVAPWTETFPDVEVREVVSTRHPAAALLSLAHPQHPAPARLLVVGRRGSGGFRRLLLGSVSSSVIAYADCPVAVVNGRGDRPGEPATREEAAPATPMPVA